jgi:DnaJ-class molecular chaperone
MSESKCNECNGCGFLADSDDQEPWSAWQQMPLQSAIAVLGGVVKPKVCEKCKGMGKVMQP